MGRGRPSRLAPSFCDRSANCLTGVVTGLQWGGLRRLDGHDPEVTRCGSNTSVTGPASPRFSLPQARRSATTRNSLAASVRYGGPSQTRRPIMLEGPPSRPPTTPRPCVIAGRPGGTATLRAFRCVRPSSIRPRLLRAELLPDACPAARTRGLLPDRPDDAGVCDSCPGRPPNDRGRLPGPVLQRVAGHSAGRQGRGHWFSPSTRPERAPAPQPNDSFRYDGGPPAPCRCRPRTCSRRPNRSHDGAGAEPRRARSVAAKVAFPAFGERPANRR